MNKEMLEAIDYINNNKLHTEVNKLYIKVGDPYMATWMIYKNINLTQENIDIAKDIVKEHSKEQEKLWNEKIQRIN